MPIQHSLSTKDRIALAHRALDEYVEAMKKPKIRAARLAAENLLGQAVFLATASGLLPEGRIFYEDPRKLPRSESGHAQDSIRSDGPEA